MVEYQQRDARRIGARPATNFVVVGLVIILITGVFVGANAENNQLMLEAILDNNLEVVKSLLDRGTDINSMMNGGTALMWAAGTDRLEMAKLLIDKGADVNAKNQYGGTALIWASNQGHLELINLLKAHGAR
jgi:ankyrin repeat protein